MKGLPFLKQKRWPGLAKISGESRYGFSEDDELAERSLDELMRALETKDQKAMLSALEALIDIIMNRGESDASDPLQDASGV